MTHVEAIKEILEQFDRYKSNCLGCKKAESCDDVDWDFTDNCENNNLICREKLLEAADELDHTD